jgi:arsenate reductase-like glutaredoxin family protein
MKIKSFTTPKKNKEIFIDPAHNDIPGLIDLNKERFQSYDFNINGMPFSQFREQVRSETVKKAGEYTDKIWSLCSKLNIACTEDLSCVRDSYTSERNIIQTGHSPALAHPGVLIKHSLVNSIAKKVNGVGINMVVDNDASNDNCLNIPDINGMGSSVENLEYLPGLRNLAFEEIRYADPTQLTAFKKSVAKALYNPDMKKTFEDFMNVVIMLSGETLQFSDLFTFARCVFLTRFGINNLEVPVSLISETDSFLQFFLHITANLKSFVNIYNTKLSEYRNLKKISSKANPLPDLMEKGFVVEMPFWIWKEGEQRKSLFASVANDSRISILCENKIVEHFDFGGRNGSTKNLENLERLKGLISNGIKVRPKAIANTMYSRMFFSDLFIHGIGGAKYDLITDEIVREFFGVEPPEYATISATLHLPYEPLNVSKEDVIALKHVIKDMGYNPDRYASDEIMEDSEMRSMVREKKELIAKESHDAKEKHLTFDRIKQLNSLMKEKISPLIKEKEKEMENLEMRLKYNAITTNREYPFCIYPESMMQELFKLS